MAQKGDFHLLMLLSLPPLFGACLLNCIMVYVTSSLISQTIYSALQEDVDPEDATLMLA